MLSLQVTQVYTWNFFVLFCTKNNFSTVLSGVGKWVDLELHFNVDLIHLITAEGCIEMLCYSSFSVYLLSLLCLRISVFPLFDGLRVLIEKAKMLKNFNVLGKATESYAVVKRCRQPVEELVFDSMGSG